MYFIGIKATAADIVMPLPDRDPARQFEHAIIGRRRHIELTHRRTHQVLILVLQIAKLPYVPNTYIRVAKDGMFGFKFREVFALYIARGLDAFANAFA